MFVGLSGWMTMTMMMMMAEQNHKVKLMIISDAGEEGGKKQIDERDD